MKLACLISAKNLGDAVGHASVLAQLARAGYAQRFIVWTKPESAFLFESVANCEVVTCKLPMGTGTRFKAADVAPLLGAARRIRRLAPEVTLDLVGDVRERWLARLAGSRRHLYIGWAADHPFSNLIRNPFGHGQPLITIPASVPNVYDAYSMFVSALGANPQSRPREQPLPSRRLHIGLHPFASQACKLWPMSNWVTLAGKLLNDKHRLTVFASPPELAQLCEAFTSLAGRVDFVAKSLPEFDRVIEKLDLMVGLDSFSVHVAYRHKIRTIMLNAGNPRDLWGPPGGSVLGRGERCSRYPCFNVPRCDAEKRYICIRDIEVSMVLTEIQRIIESNISVPTNP